MIAKLGELAIKEKEESLRAALEMDLNTIDMLAYAIQCNVYGTIDDKERARAIVTLVKEAKKKVVE